MPIYRHKPSGCWMFEFSRRVDGRRVRKRQLLPAGWTRAQADAYDRAQSSALYAVASGVAKPRHRIDEAVTRYTRERAPALKHGENVKRELEGMRDWWAGRAIDDLAVVCQEYAEDQHGALAPATIKNRIAYLRAACRYAWKRHGMAESDPGARVQSPTVRNARDIVVSRADMLRIASACPHRPTRALIRVLWYSGLRLGEARVAVRVPGAFVIPAVDSKNDSPRIVPVHPRIRPATALPMPDRGTLYYWWEKARDAAGFGHVHLHDLRHAAATEMVSAGIDLGTVAAVLGHKTMQTTKRYSHHAVSRLAEAVGTIGKRRG